MSDLISRQAVVTEIAKFMLKYGGENEKRERDALHRAANGIKALPPAQAGIIRCKECKHYKAYDYTGYLACHLVVGGTVRRDLDDFCSRAER